MTKINYFLFLLSSHISGILNSISPNLFEQVKFLNKQIYNEEFETKFLQITPKSDPIGFEVRFS